MRGGNGGGREAKRVRDGFGDGYGRRGGGVMWRQGDVDGSAGENYGKWGSAGSFT